MERHLVEVEIKSLLGDEEKAKELKQKMLALDPSCRLIDSNSQLNHYFTGGDSALFQKNFLELISLEERDRFLRILSEGKNLSIRTRKADENVLFVIKASIDDATSFNGTARIEFESKMAMSIDELDALVLSSGCAYQAKWSRDREEYEMSDGTHICIDRNAGYGYLAEFERVVSEEMSADEVKKELRALMEKLEVAELPQDRLERMFAHYNKHWQEYYGTEKTFTVE
jgi:adenylate cyclase class IV